ncbi:MAG: anthranilate phosphoribosyltransferase [Pseudomonadota bacterium]
MSAFTPFLAAAVSGDPLDAPTMRGAMSALLSGDATDIEIAGFLAALRTRGETVDEISTAARVMREKAEHAAAPDNAIDTCGTGGDGAGTYNISTAAAIVAAGAGAKVAKHGNRAASSKSGSSDVLAALGVNIQCPPEIMSACIEEAGVGFMFAPHYHAAVAHVGAARKGLGVRTLFNLLGPISNPAGAKRQVMGVFGREFVKPMAEVLGALGSVRAWVVHGADGLDELTTTDLSYVAELHAGTVREFTVAPEDAGLARAAPADLVGGGPEDNAQAIRDLLDGAPGAFRDIVALNAGAALLVADVAASLTDGVERAQASIDNGAAKTALERLIKGSTATP